MSNNIGCNNRISSNEEMYAYLNEKSSYTEKIFELIDYIKNNGIRPENNEYWSIVDKMEYYEEEKSYGEDDYKIQWHYILTVDGKFMCLKETESSRYFYNLGTEPPKIDKESKMIECTLEEIMMETDFDGDAGRSQGAFVENITRVGRINFSEYENPNVIRKGLQKGENIYNLIKSIADNMPR